MLSPPRNPLGGAGEDVFELDHARIGEQVHRWGGMRDSDVIARCPRSAK